MIVAMIIYRSLVGVVAEPLDAAADGLQAARMLSSARGVFRTSDAVMWRSLDFGCRARL